MAPRPDWNLRLVRSREARRLLPKVGGGSDAVAWGAIRVAHLDTGYTEHPVFGDWAAGTEWLRVADGLNLREPGRPPRDPLDYEGNPGHGTRTCSILCGDAAPPPAGSGIPPNEIGVAPRLPVVPCRIVDGVVLTPERARKAVAAGIGRAIAKGCQVVSISLGIPTFPPWAKGGMGEAVDRAYEVGVIIVAAAGQVVDRICYPAKYDRTIGVGGVTWQRRIWFGYAISHDPIDVWAPAEGVTRADSLAPAGGATVAPIEGSDPGASGLSGADSDSSALSGGSHSGKYGKGAGTSYATTHVAAAAAMWLLARRDAIGDAYPAPWQRVEAFRRLLRQTATPINGARPTNGTGILDIEALLRAGLPAAASLKKAPKDEDKWA